MRTDVRQKIISKHCMQSRRVAVSYHYLRLFKFSSKKLYEVQ